MELRQLRYVLAVAETAHFTRAARRCHVVQSALSHQIAALERELGTRLFDRTSRSVRLTAAGEAFVPLARQAVEAAERAEAAVRAGRLRGRLAVGAVPTLTALDLPAQLAGYRDRHPEVAVSVRAGASRDLVAEVRTGGLDVGFLGVPVDERPAGVRYRTLVVDEHVALVGPGHRWAGRERVDLAELAGEPFVDFRAGTAARAQSDRAFAAAGLTREVAFETDATEFLAGFVRHGLAVGLLPGGFARRLPGLCPLPVTGGPRRAQRMIWRRAHASPATVAFLEHLRADGIGEPRPDQGDDPGGADP